ncbi:MAG TPA: thrombospondin type 3 repeat-containing protein [candidate division Zixibacteria bacterium]|nr:thrombospondin type 3 repeat-containing protein [candidate division Zixibacteria bacterium]
MKHRITLTVLTLILALAVAGQAEEWGGKIGISGRGVGLAPLFEGSSFDQFDETYEPFRMGWDFGLEARYGLTNRWVIGLGYAWINTYDDSSATSDQSFSFRDKDNAVAHLRAQLYWLTASYNFNIEKKLQPFVMGGFGIDYWRLREIKGAETHKITDLNIKLGGGLHYWLLSWVTVDAQLRFTYDIANLDSNVPEGFYGSGDWTEWDTRPFHAYLEPSIGLTLYLGGAPDQDKDGVKDTDDQCPDTPHGAEVDNHGCPLDADQDGVYDGLDQCPNTPKGVRVDALGCPLDTDGDGVYDSFDQCPNTPAGMQVDDQGCPPDADRDGVADENDDCPDTPLGATVDEVGCPSDSDKDGVLDGIDKCPGTPKGTTVGNMGCPLDSDGDGVMDDNDACPNTPADVEVDLRGCPVAQEIKEEIVLSGKVNYASGSYELTDTAKATLDGVVASMKAYPETKIEIKGFTDSQGSETANMTLSQNRANAALEYLKSKGIAESRMTATGLGENPQYFIGDNDTVEGRQMNRRVTISKVE